MTTAPSASDAGVSFDHQSIDVDRFDDVSIVGDVHGGVDPTGALCAHSNDDLQTMRSPNSVSASDASGGSSDWSDGDGYDGPFRFDEYAERPRVFFGHTVLETPLERVSRPDETFVAVGEQ